MPASNPRGRWDYKWTVVTLMFLAGFLNLEDRVVIFSVLPLIKRDLLLSDLQSGALMSVFLWVYAAFSPFAGYLGDRWSRRKVIIQCVLWWSLITILTGLVTSGSHLLVSRVLLALAQAFYIPASMAIVADFHPAETRGRAFSLLFIGMNLGPIIGGGIAGWIGDHYGWRPTLWVLGAGGLGLALLLLVFLKDAPTSATERGPVERSRIAETIFHLAKTPTYLFLLFATGMQSLAVWMLLAWLPIFLNEVFHMNLASSGFFGNFAIGVTASLGSLLGGFISDRYSGGRPRARSLILIACYGLACPWPLLFWHADRVFIVLSAVALLQFFRSVGDCSLYPLLYDIVGPKLRSTAIGLSNTANCMFGGFGAIVAGYYKQTAGIQMVFGLVAIPLALATLGLVVAHRAFLNKDIQRNVSELSNQLSAPSLAPAPGEIQL